MSLQTPLWIGAEGRPGGGLEAAFRQFQLMQNWCCRVFIPLQAAWAAQALLELQVPDQTTWGGSWGFPRQEKCCHPFILTSHVQFVIFCFPAQFLLLLCNNKRQEKEIKIISCAGLFGCLQVHLVPFVLVAESELVH